MSIYNDYILPPILNLAMQAPGLGDYRQRLLGQAHGRVLEIGIGSGLNLPYYGAAVTEIIGLDPSPRLLEMTRQRSARAGRPVTLLAQPARAIALEDGSIDTVVSTWTLCSITPLAPALAEICRVLRPQGQFLFVEHGLAPDKGVQRWQHRLTPAWSQLAGGCHLNRPIDRLVREAGFRIERLDTGYMSRAPRLLSHMYLGRAVPEP